MSARLRDVYPSIRHQLSGTADCRLFQVSGRQSAEPENRGGDIINPQ